MTVKNNRGFTLLEVAVTLAILATTLTVIISQVIKGINLSTDAKFSSLSTILAREKMTEFEISGYPAIGTQQGDFGKDYPAFSWLTQVSEAGVEDVRQVIVTVRWGEGAYHKEWALTNYLFKGE